MSIPFVLSIITSAVAGDCDVGDAPVGYPAAGCNDVCYWVENPGSDSIVCDLARNGETEGGDFYASTSWGSSAHDFSFWGTDASGSDFCCVFDEALLDQVSQVNVDGSTYADTMTFNNRVAQFLGGQSLWDPSPGGAAAFDLSMSGLDGDDTMEGTYVSTSKSSQWLGGDDGNDDIRCHESCTVMGLGGSDTIVGSEDADLIYGDTFSDSVLTTGNDLISGGAGDDVIHGGTGHDTICGDADSDEIWGEGGSDDLWGGDGGVTDDDWTDGGADGGIYLDECLAETMTPNCDATLATEPSACPE